MIEHLMTTEHTLPWPAPGYAFPSARALREWAGVEPGHYLTDSEFRELRDEWRTAAKHAGYVLVYLNTATGEIGGV